MNDNALNQGSVQVAWYLAMETLLVRVRIVVKQDKQRSRDRSPPPHYWIRAPPETLHGRGVNKADSGYALVLQYNDHAYHNLLPPSSTLS